MSIPSKYSKVEKKKRTLSRSLSAWHTPTRAHSHVGGDGVAVVVALLPSSVALQLAFLFALQCSVFVLSPKPRDSSSCIPKLVLSLLCSVCLFVCLLACLLVCLFVLCSSSSSSSGLLLLLTAFPTLSFWLLLWLFSCRHTHLQV
jgi:hypothetical protein